MIKMRIKYFFVFLMLATISSANTFGTWVLKKQTLRIHGSSDYEIIYFVEKATSKQLILRRKGEAPETYVREECIQFELPKE